VIDKMFSYFESAMQSMINDFLYEVQDVAWQLKTMEGEKKYFGGCLF
jgi:hypothetical protein